MTKHKKQASTVRITATNGLRHLQLMVCVVLLIASVGVFAQEAQEGPPVFGPEGDVQDFFREEENPGFDLEKEAPKFVVPPDPTIPYLDAIDAIEEELGPYATDLSDLYLGLGEVFLNREEYEEARDAYHRGVMVVRVNAGPNSPEQTNLLYLIANIETLLDEPKQASRILTNIRFINEQYFGANSPELYPVFQRMYEWYETARPLDVEESKYKDYLTIIDLTEGMVDISKVSNGLSTPEAAWSYRHFAEAHFEAMRFALAEEDWIDPRIIVASDVPYRVTPGFEDLSMREHYIEGRNAFRTYLELVQADESKTPLDYAEALADMADWSLYFEKYRAARKLYEEAYQVLAASTEYSDLIDEYMGQPQPMEFTGIRAGENGAPLEAGSMSIDISMTVTRIGDVRYVKILNPPERLTDDDLTEIRRMVQDTPFRPSLKGGKAVTTEGFIWQHVIHFESEDDTRIEERTS